LHYLKGYPVPRSCVQILYHYRGEKRRIQAAKKGNSHGRGREVNPSNFPSRKMFIGGVTLMGKGSSSIFDTQRKEKKNNGGIQGKGDSHWLLLLKKKTPMNFLARRRGMIFLQEGTGKRGASVLDPLMPEREERLMDSLPRGSGRGQGKVFLFSGRQKIKKEDVEKKKGTSLPLKEGKIKKARRPRRLEGGKKGQVEVSFGQDRGSRVLQEENLVSVIVPIRRKKRGGLPYRFIVLGGEKGGGREKQHNHAAMGKNT